MTVVKTFGRVFSIFILYPWICLSDDVGNCFFLNSSTTSLPYNTWNSGIIISGPSSEQITWNTSHEQSTYNILPPGLVLVTNLTLVDSLLANPSPQDGFLRPLVFYPGSLVSLENVHIYTSCSTLAAYQAYACSQLSPKGLLVSPGWFNVSSFYDNSADGAHVLSFLNVSVSCNIAEERDNNSTAEAASQVLSPRCLSQSASSCAQLRALFEDLQLQADEFGVGNIFVNIASSISLADDVSWPDAGVEVSKNFTLAGSCPITPGLDLGMRRGLLRLNNSASTANITLVCLELVNLGLGSAADGALALLATPTWFIEAPVNISSSSAVASSPKLIHLINVTLVLFEDEITYLSHWLSIYNSPFSDVAAAASWLADLAELGGISGSGSSELHVSSAWLLRQYMRNVSLRHYTSTFPIQYNRSGIYTFSNDSVVPLTIVTAIYNCSNFVAALSTNSSTLNSVLVLMANVSLSNCTSGAAYTGRRLAEEPQKSWREARWRGAGSDSGGGDSSPLEGRKKGRSPGKLNHRGSDEIPYAMSSALNPQGLESWRAVAGGGGSRARSLAASSSLCASMLSNASLSLTPKASVLVVGGFLGRPTVLDWGLRAAFVNAFDSIVLTFKDLTMINNPMAGGCDEAHSLQLSEWGPLVHLLWAVNQSRPTINIILYNVKILVPVEEQKLLYALATKARPLDNHLSVDVITQASVLFQRSRLLGHNDWSMLFQDVYPLGIRGFNVNFTSQAEMGGFALLPLEVNYLGAAKKGVAASLITPAVAVPVAVVLTVVLVAIAVHRGLLPWGRGRPDHGVELPAEGIQDEHSKSSCNANSKRPSVGERINCDSSGAGAPQLHFSKLLERPNTFWGISSPVLFDACYDSFDRPPSSLYGPSEGPGEDGSDVPANEALAQLIMNFREDMKHEESLEIAEQVGVGGFGVVYRGVWQGLQVAVKTMCFGDHVHGPNKGRSAALREAAICCSLQHPNVVATYSYDIRAVRVVSGDAFGKSSASLRSDLPSNNSNLTDTHDGGLGMRIKEPEIREWKLYLIQEYCAGGPLQNLIDRNVFKVPDGKGLQMEKILSTAIDIACGIFHIHTKGIVHGDLNPANVLIVTNPPGAPSPFSAKIADFGLSVKLQTHQTHFSNLRQGTPCYLAPEVAAQGLLTQAADTYAFGIILWELAYGTPHWRKGHSSRGGGPASSRSSLDRRGSSHENSNASSNKGRRDSNAPSGSQGGSVHKNPTFDRAASNSTPRQGPIAKLASPLLDSSARGALGLRLTPEKERGSGRLGTDPKETQQEVNEPPAVLSNGGIGKGTPQAEPKVRNGEEGNEHDKNGNKRGDDVFVEKSNIVVVAAAAACIAREDNKSGAMTDEPPPGSAVVEAVKQRLTPEVEICRMPPSYGKSSESTAAYGRPLDPPSGQAQIVGASDARALVANRAATSGHSRHASGQDTVGIGSGNCEAASGPAQRQQGLGFSSPAEVGGQYAMYVRQVPLLFRPLLENLPVPPEYRALMKQCLQEEAVRRPKFHVILAKLSCMQQRLDPNAYERALKTAERRALLDALALCNVNGLDDVQEESERESQD